jgi:hypothetical protein
MISTEDPEFKMRLISALERIAKSLEKLVEYDEYEINE